MHKRDTVRPPDDPAPPAQVTPIAWHRYDAVLFDLDGVITRSASVHAEAWKETFDAFLEHRALTTGATLEPFDIDTDYALYVDGLPRLDGIRAFLRARDLDLPEGAPGDPPSADTVSGLADLKNTAFRRILAQKGVALHHDGLALLREVRRQGCRIGLVTSSRNAAAVLAAAGLNDAFDVLLDGVAAATAGLAGKPAPDTFLEAARRLDAPAARTAVIEDSIAGIAAARAGGFALVVAVDRAGIPEQLAAAGADIVVADLTQLMDGTDHAPTESPE